MSDQDPIAVLQDRKVLFSIYPEGSRVSCSIGFDTLRARFGPLDEAGMCQAVLDHMHLVEAAAVHAWRGTPLGEAVLVRSTDF